MTIIFKTLCLLDHLMLQASNRTFGLTATAEVSVGGFQQDDDQNIADNSGKVSAVFEHLQISC